MYKKVSLQTWNTALATATESITKSCTLPSATDTSYVADVRPNTNDVDSTFLGIFGEWLAENDNYDFTSAKCKDGVTCDRFLTVSDSDNPAMGQISRHMGTFTVTVVAVYVSDRVTFFSFSTTKPTNLVVLKLNVRPFRAFLPLRHLTYFQFANLTNLDQVVYHIPSVPLMVVHLHLVPLQSLYASTH